MKLLSIENSRALQLFDPDEIKPRGGVYLPDFIRLIAERYGFVTVPNVEQVKSGAQFRDGRLIAGNKKINVPELSVYNDGIAVTAPSTEDADFVADDAINWLQQHFAFRDPVTKHPRQYESHLVVTFDAAIGDAIEGFKNIKRAFQISLQESYGVEISVDLSRLVFSSDPTHKRNLFNTEFSIERRIGRPYSENRFFSSAPLKNQAHLILLEYLEEEMSSGRNS